MFLLLSQVALLKIKEWHFICVDNLDVTFSDSNLDRLKCLYSMSNTQMDQVFSYSTNWKEGKVNQMWIQQITPEYQECDHKYVAIAYNPEKNVSMVMSNPRSHYDTLNWVRNFCGSFSILN